ncbi:MAG: helix-turn-helix transcriptional regulator [Alphaproteobacteria bacterium]
MTREQLSSFIKRNRLNKSISLQHMAKQIGVTPEALCRMESGKYWINSKNLFAILEVLKIKLIEDGSS